VGQNPRKQKIHNGPEKFYKKSGAYSAEQGSTVQYDGIQERSLWCILSQHSIFMGFDLPFSTGGI